MLTCDTLIRNARIIDGSRSGAPDAGGSNSAASKNPLQDVAIANGRILAIHPATDAASHAQAIHQIDAAGMVLAPGFIDAHTHDDTNVIRTPQMLPKLSQGVTTVIVGNCGISAAPATIRGHLPDPMNLLGAAEAFTYPDFCSYLSAIEKAQPAVNVAALVGHTTLRNNHMDRLDRSATGSEIAAMRHQLDDALSHGAIGLSTGLAYLSAYSASTEEVLALAEALHAHQAIYTTHLRSETETIVDALHEAFLIGKAAGVAIVVPISSAPALPTGAAVRRFLPFSTRPAPARPSASTATPTPRARVPSTCARSMNA